jgi:hypothetical protein
MDKTTINATISGFRVRKFDSTEGKKEEQLGMLKLALIADKEDLKVNDSLGQLTIGDLISALTIHQSSRDEVEISLNFSVPTELAKKILDARRVQP